MAATQYQSFLDVQGDSHSFQKLKALRFPAMKGKRFLDLGCNEGFFCAYAASRGAKEVIGIDNTAAFIDRAKARFPSLIFKHQDWEQLPQGKFDVILLASALHYARDQVALIHALMSKVSPDGMLILECGVVRKNEPGFVEVDRGMDKRLFPTITEMQLILQRYAFKEIGPSIDQVGDPIPRFVFHIQHRKPFAFLLTQPPFFGKSTIARCLTDEHPHLRMVRVDEVINNIMRGESEVPEWQMLKRKLSPVYKMEKLGALFEMLTEAGAYEPICQALLKACQELPGDIVFDGYLPNKMEPCMHTLLEANGYVVVKMESASPMSIRTQDLGAEEYIAVGEQRALWPSTLNVKGCIDTVRRHEEWLAVSGWAVHPEDGKPVTQFVCVSEQYTYPVTQPFSLQRPDVTTQSQHLQGLTPAKVGFAWMVTLKPDDRSTHFQIFAQDRFGGLCRLRMPAAAA